MLKFTDEEGSDAERWFRARVAEAVESYAVFPFSIITHAGATYGKQEDPEANALYVAEPQDIVFFSFSNKWKMPYCVVDIGANVGAFTYVASLFSSDVRAYEPCQGTFDRLNENVKKYVDSETTTVQTFRLAAGSTTGRTVFMSAHESGLSGDSYSSESKPESESEEVETICFEDILATTPQGRIDYLKVDCEGAEYDFLLGKDLSKVGHLEIELHGNNEDIKQTLANHIEKTHGTQVTRTGGHDSGISPITYIKGINRQLLDTSAHITQISGLRVLRTDPQASNIDGFSYTMSWGDDAATKFLAYELPYNWKYYVEHIHNKSVDHNTRLMKGTKDD